MFDSLAFKINSLYMSVYSHMEYLYNIFKIDCSFFSVDKKEQQAGHDPAQELKDSGFHDVGRV